MKQYLFPLTPEEAVEYLRDVRGILYSVASLRNLRRRGRAVSHGVKKRTTLWTKEELDAIKASPRTRLATTNREGDSSEEGDHFDGCVTPVTPHVQRPLSSTASLVA